jgi:hypothetical protein
VRFVGHIQGGNLFISRYPPIKARDPQRGHAVNFERQRALDGHETAEQEVPHSALVRSRSPRMPKSSRSI